VSSLQYPIAVYGLEGDSVGSIGVAPPSFATPPVVERGHFSGPAAGERLNMWLEGFTTIGSLNVVGDRFLIVTHARMRTGTAERFVQEHYALDVYDYLENRKVFEDVPLPADSRVLAGGRHLYLLVAEPPAPWTVLRLNVNLPEATGR
jgi:hypothetical protein